MREIVPDRLENGRVRSGPFASVTEDGLNGCFFVHGPCGEELQIIANEAHPNRLWWEHVGISIRRRIPNWREMCFVKDLFWSEEECVVQFHPPRSEYVNCHPNCLHLWRNAKQDFLLPPAILVGIKDVHKPSAEELDAIRAWKGR